MKEIDTQPRRVPFVTDEDRTASDMLLAIAHNISVTLVSLARITSDLAELTKREAEARVTKAFSFTFHAPAEWAKTEKTACAEPSPAAAETQPATNETQPAAAETKAAEIPAENPPKSEEKQ